MRFRKVPLHVGRDAVDCIFTDFLFGTRRVLDTNRHDRLLLYRSLLQLIKLLEQRALGNTQRDLGLDRYAGIPVSLDIVQRLVGLNPEVKAQLHLGGVKDVSPLYQIGVGVNADPFGSFAPTFDGWVPNAPCPARTPPPPPAEPGPSSFDRPRPARVEPCPP